MEELTRKEFMEHWWDAFIKASNDLLEIEDACEAADEAVRCLEERLAKRYKIDPQNTRPRTGVL